MGGTRGSDVVVGGVLGLGFTKPVEIGVCGTCVCVCAVVVLRGVGWWTFFMVWEGG